MKSQGLEDEYIIHIDYDPNVDNLAASLQTLSKIVAGHSAANSILVNAFDQQVVSSIVMQKIEKSSIRLFIKNVIKNTDQKEIKSLGVKAFLRQALVEARNLAFDYMDKNDEIKNVEDLQEFRNGCVVIADKAGASSTIGIETLSERHVAEVIDGLSISNKGVREGQKVKVIVAGEEHEVNRNFRYNASKVEEMLLAEDQSWLDQEKRIRIRQLAYEGESRWLVQDIEGHNYKAKILDTDWLTKFQSGTLPPNDFPKPKSILVVRGDITIQLDNTGFQTGRTFDIHKVVKVENPEGGENQLRIEYEQDE